MVATRMSPLRDRGTIVLMNANGIGIVETNLSGLTNIWLPLPNGNVRDGTHQCFAGVGDRTRAGRSAAGRLKVIVCGANGLAGTRIT